MYVLTFFIGTDVSILGLVLFFTVLMYIGNEATKK